MGRIQLHDQNDNSLSPENLIMTTVFDVSEYASWGEFLLSLLSSLAILFSTVISFVCYWILYGGQLNSPHDQRYATMQFVLTYPTRSPFDDRSRLFHLSSSPMCRVHTLFVVSSESHSNRFITHHPLFP